MRKKRHPKSKKSKQARALMQAKIKKLTGAKIEVSKTNELPNPVFTIGPYSDGSTV